MPAEAKDLLAATRDAGGKLRQAISEIRGRIRELRDERHRVEHRPPPIDIVQNRADEFVRSHAARANDKLPGITRALLAPPGRYKQPSVTSDEHGSLLLASLGDMLAAKLKADVAADYDEQGETGISDADRADELERLDQQLLDAELAEESLLRSGEEAGFAIHRRPDADPRAVLADEESLP